MPNNFCETDIEFRIVDQKEMQFRHFLSRALAAPLFIGTEPFVQF